MLDYKNIGYLHDINEAFKKFNFNKDFTEALDDVLAYADDCYIDHCEEIGMVAIEEIKDMEQEVKDKAWSWIELACIKHPIKESELEVLKQDYLRYMEE